MTVLILLAGKHRDIEVDKKMRPKNLTWKGCLKLLKDPMYLLRLCLDVTDMVGHDEMLDSALERIGKEYLS